MDLTALATGLSDSLNSYLQAGQQQKRTQQNIAFNNQQQLSQSEDLAKFKQGMEGQVTPDMAEQLIPGASKWVNSFQQQNQRLPTINEVNDGLNSVQEKLQKLQGSSGKANTKHYIGNSPDGDAIFSDNDGNMITPDKKVYTGQVLPKSSTMATSSTRGSAEFATTILPHITEMRDLIKQADAAGYIGPASGRIYNQFLAGKVGSTGDENADQLLGKLRAMDSLLKTGAMRVHFGARGGANMYDHFSDMLNSGKQSAANLNGSLDTMEDFMKGYASAGQPKGAKPKNQPDSTGWKVIK